MSTTLLIRAAGPLTSLQDKGRFGFLAAGLSASGPLDRRAYEAARAALGAAGETVIEFTAGLVLELVAGTIRIAGAGADFRVTLNGAPVSWPLRATLKAGDRLHVDAGRSGSFGVLAFSGEVDLPPVLGSRATNTIAGLGGRVLVAGDTLRFTDEATAAPPARVQPTGTGPIRVLPGLHASMFPPALHERFFAASFTIAPERDRMGMRLRDPEGVFQGLSALSLVSEPIVAGDIQILGDGTPVVLLRDHQPVGGYPRFATVISADFARLAQMRTGETVRFAPISLARAQELL